MQPASLRVLLQPAPQPRPLAQQRLVRDLDLALADRDQAVVGQHRDLARSRRRARRSGTRRRTTASPFPPASRSRMRRATGRWSGRAARTRARRAAPPRRARRRRARRRPGAGGARRGAARAPAAWSTAAAARRGARRRPRAARRRARARPPARRAARAARSRGAARRGASARRARGRRRAAARAPGTARNGRRSRRGWRPARAPAARIAARDQRIGEGGRSSSSRQTREHLFELIDGDDVAAVGAVRRSPPRARAAAALRAAAARSPSARCPAARQRPAPASRPARSAEDLPLPDGPTMAINGAPASRATSSATSRSRPKK